MFDALVAVMAMLCVGCALGAIAAMAEPKLERLEVRVRVRPASQTVRIGRTGSTRARR